MMIEEDCPFQILFTRHDLLVLQIIINERSCESRRTTSSVSHTVLAARICVGIDLYWVISYTCMLLSYKDLDFR